MEINKTESLRTAGTAMFFYYSQLIHWFRFLSQSQSLLLQAREGEISSRGALARSANLRTSQRTSYQCLPCRLFTAHNMHFLEG